MSAIVLLLIVLVVGLVLFDMAAAAFGADSRPSLGDDHRYEHRA